MNITLKVLLGLGEQGATGFAPSGNILSCFLIQVVLIGFLLGNQFQERHPVARYGRTWPVESMRGYGVNIPLQENEKHMIVGAIVVNASKLSNF